MKKLFIRSRSNGSALVIVAFTVMILSFFVMQFAQATIQYQREQGGALGRINAYHAARSGLEYVLLMLETTAEETATGEEILGNARFVYRFVNEDAKWDLNSLVDGDGNIIVPQAEGIGRYLEAEGWGKEKQELVNEFASKVPFQTAAQLALLPSVGSFEKARRLRAGLTVYSAGKVNLNTASESVLLSLSPRMTETVARGIVKLRQKKRFQSVAQLKDILGMNELLFADIEEKVDVGGKYYTVAVTGIFGKTEVTMGAVVKRNADGVALVQMREPLRDEDLFCVD